MMPGSGISADFRRGIRTARGFGLNDMEVKVGSPENVSVAGKS